ncbi:MAG: hypothetical protein JW982_16590 [Spirochaetes bacterium]|nr:hypothetical protein [Spirochaetota bacterium]
MEINEKVKIKTVPYLHRDIVEDDSMLKELIYENMQYDLFWTDDWSVEFYIECAYAGLISISKDHHLLPEMQTDYAVLDWKDLHVSKRLRSSLSMNYQLKLNSDYEAVLDGIEKHHAPDNWLQIEYRRLLNELFSRSDWKYGFVPQSVELYDGSKLIAGEIGYVIGKTYTSLTGFFLREREYNNAGKLQLIMLARYLEKNNFDFWNMGHPHMQYKKDIGARILPRKEFLKRWFASRNAVLNVNVQL